MNRQAAVLDSGRLMQWHDFGAVTHVEAAEKLMRSLLHRNRDDAIIYTRDEGSDTMFDHTAIRTLRDDVKIQSHRHDDWME